MTCMSRVCLPNLCDHFRNILSLIVGRKTLKNLLRRTPRQAATRMLVNIQIYRDKNMESLDNNAASIAEVDTIDSKICLNDAKFIEDEKHETAELEKNCSIPIKEEIYEMLVKTKEESDTEEDVPGLFIKTELDDTKEILRFDESGILLNVDCKIIKKEADVIESNNVLFGQEQQNVNEKNFACEYCNKKFSKKKHRNEHVKFLHENEKEFACQFCKKQFARKNRLVIHERIHTGEKPYQCEECEKGFIDKRELKRHTDYAHSLEKKFVCDECGKDLTRASHLKYHKMAVHGIGDTSSSFVCPHCSKVFHRQDQLSQHVKTHSSELFPCNICGKEFNVKVNMRRHIKSHSEI